MRRAIVRLYAQWRTEASFGWYTPDPKWRHMLRELYPVEWVAAHHRGSYSDEAIMLHARRVMAFNVGLSK